MRSHTQKHPLVGSTIMSLYGHVVLNGNKSAKQLIKCLWCTDYGEPMVDDAPNSSPVFSFFRSRQRPTACSCEAIVNHANAQHISFQKTTARPDSTASALSCRALDGCSMQRLSLADVAGGAWRCARTANILPLQVILHSDVHAHYCQSIAQGAYDDRKTDSAASVPHTSTYKYVLGGRLLWHGINRSS